MITQVQSNLTDVEAIENARQGDGDAFRVLVERYFGMVYSIGYARLMNRESAEELTQEVFLRVYLNLAQLREPRYFATWLTHVTRNITSTWQTQRRTRSQLITLVPLSTPETLMIASSEPNARERAMAAEDTAFVRGLLQELTPEEREVVLLHFVEDLSKSEIARRLGVHPSSVGRQLDRILQQLNRRIKTIMSRGGRSNVVPLNVQLKMSVKPGRAAVARASAVVAGVALLGGEGQAALQQAALLPANLATAAAITTPVTSGFLAAAKIKLISGLAVGALLIGGTVYMNNRSESPSQSHAAVTTEITRTTARAPGSDPVSATTSAAVRSTSSATSIASSQPTTNDSATTSSPIIASATTSATSGSASISGHVFLYATGEAVPESTVEIVQAYAGYGTSFRDQRAVVGKTTTDDMGAYTVGGLTSGTYMIRASKDDLMQVPPDHQQAHPAFVSVPDEDIIHLEDSTTTSGFKLSLFPGITVTGTVRNILDGKPLKDIKVVSNLDLKENAVLTDSAGRYRLNGVFGQHPWTCSGKLRISTRGYLEVDSTGDPESVKMFTMRPDQPVIEHDIWLQPTLKISGKVLLPNGEPANGAIVNAWARGNFYTAPGDRTDESGLFSIDVKPLSHVRLAVQLEDYPTTRTTEFTIDDSSTTVPDILLEKPASLSGVVIDDAGAPVANAQVKWESPGSLRNSMPFTTAQGTYVKTDANGEFALSMLPPGAFAYTTSKALHRTVTLDNQFLNAGETSTGATVILPRGLHYIKGRVLDVNGGAVAGAQVQAEEALATFPYQAVAVDKSDDNGWYKLEGLFDETYDVWAMHPDVGYDVKTTQSVDQDRLDFVIGGEKGPARIYGTVIDAETRQPVPNFDAVPRATIRVEKSSTTGEFIATATVQPPRRSSFTFLISADGYESTTTEHIQFPVNERTVRRTFPLRKE